MSLACVPFGRRGSSLPVALALAAGLAGGLACPAWAVPGALDPTFGSSGLVVRPSDSAGPLSLVLQDDGKILIAGTNEDDDVYVERYLTNGEPDGRFGVNGRAVFPSRGVDSASTVLQMRDGRILVAGTTQTSRQAPGNFLLARMDRNGRPDASFGQGGRVTTDMGGDDRLNAAALRGDGTITVAGLAGTSRTATFALARYDFQGRLDRSFGRDGKVFTPFQAWAQANALAIQTDGRIVAGGTTGPADEEGRLFQEVMALARYNRDGSLDRTFDGDGRVITQFQRDDNHEGDTIWTLVIQPNGRIVAGGTSRMFGEEFAVMARYTSRGALDPTFDRDGKLLMLREGGRGRIGDAVLGLALQRDGRIVTTGVLNASVSGVTFVARHLPSGALDLSFGARGVARLPDQALGENLAWAVAIQTNGRIVVAGDASSVGDLKEPGIYLARFLSR